MDLWILEHIAPIFYTLLELSLAAVCIGLGVLLLRKLLDKKIPPIWKNALWLLMLVALVMPFRPTSSTAVIPTTEVDFRQQGIQLVVEVAEASTESGTSGRVPAETVAQVETYETMSLIFEVMVPVLWLLGMGVMLLILLFSRIRFSGFLMACKGDSSELDSLLEECKGQLGVTQRVALYQQSYLKSPALYGLFRPTILLPDYVEALSEDSLRYILLHELSHLKHHDLWKNTALLTLQVVYWFNPLIWVLFRFIRQDMELLNDSRVLKTLDKEEETPYAMSLIEVLGHANKLPLAPQMLCMVDNKENTKRRIQMIQLGEVFKKHKLIIAVGCLAVIGVLSALFLTAKPSIDWMAEFTIDDVSSMEIVTYASGSTHIAKQPTQEEKAAVVTLCNAFYGTETQWEAFPNEEELRVTIHSTGVLTHTQCH
ncbi:M56 family metallopeptidase [Bengtsoniella intestinalis]|uniref:M56 family metallopeptidase n=1 Tax=Bengtsoniella intestinalis TaxID=3073143 RepID=UPI00391FBAB6